MNNAYILLGMAAGEACKTFLSLWYTFYMAAKKPSIRNSNRQNGKASKKHPKMFDPTKRRLVSI